MLPKTWRLVKDKDIADVYKRSKKDYSREFTIYLKKNRQDKFKLLVVVSKKISKKAVSRHRLKRKVITIFEKLKKTNRLPIGYSCIVSLKSSKLLNLRNQDIQDLLLPKISFLYKSINTNKIEKVKYKPRKSNSYNSAK